MDDFLARFIGGVAEERAMQRARGRVRTVLRWVTRIYATLIGSYALYVLAILIRDALR